VPVLDEKASRFERKEKQQKQQEQHINNNARGPRRVNYFMSDAAQRCPVYVSECVCVCVCVCC